ncbi:hypothetical protein D3C71_1550360 [compost metagenome]
MEAGRNLLPLAFQGGIGRDLVLDGFFDRFCKCADAGNHGLSFLVDDRVGLASGFGCAAGVDFAGRTWTQSETARDGSEPRNEIGQYVLLMDGPLQPIAQQGAPDVHQMQATRVGKPECFAISRGVLIIERRFLGAVTRQPFMHARHREFRDGHDLPGIAIRLGAIRQRNALRSDMLKTDAISNLGSRFMHRTREIDAPDRAFLTVDKVERDIVAGPVALLVLVGRFAMVHQHAAAPLDELF